MDTKKIGKFIADKRRELNLTQKQLAEKLGMSDKSVSKWERGVCLPDVSIYSQLCEILGISLNEFFAGEEIKPDNIETVSEENLFKVSKSSKNKQKFLKKIIASVTVLVIILLMVLASTIWGPFLPKSQITDLSKSKEVEHMNTISGPEGVYAYEFEKTDEYKDIEFYLSVYKKGKRIEKGMLMAINFENLGSSKQGKFIVIPRFEEKKVELMALCENGSYGTHFDILENVKNAKFYGRTVDYLRETEKIENNKEMGLVALYYGKNGVSAGALKSIGGKTEPYKNDYTYYVSFKFKK